MFKHSINKNYTGFFSNTTSNYNVNLIFLYQFFKKISIIRNTSLIFFKKFFKKTRKIRPFLLINFYKKKINFLKFLFKISNYLFYKKKISNWINLSEFGYTSNFNKLKRKSSSESLFGGRIFFFKTACFGKKIFLNKFNFFV